MSSKYWAWSDGQLWVCPAPFSGQSVSVYENGYDLSAFSRDADSGHFSDSIMAEDLPCDGELIQVLTNRVHRRIAEMSGDINKAQYFQQQAFILEREMRRVFADDEYDETTGIVQARDI